MTRKNTYGISADTEMLKNMDVPSARKIKGWFKVVYTDASVAMIIGVVVTSCFVIAGTGVLGPMHMAPEGPRLAVDLSNIFASKWGKFGGFLFMLAVQLLWSQHRLVSRQVGPGYWLIPSDYASLDLVVYHGRNNTGDSSCFSSLPI